VIESQVQALLEVTAICPLAALAAIKPASKAPLQKDSLSAALRNTSLYPAD